MIGNRSISHAVSDNSRYLKLSLIDQQTIDVMFNKETTEFAS